MSPHRPDRVTVLRYAAFQLPALGFLGIAGAVAHEWFGVELRWIVGALALWALKDALMFPFVWRAYAPGNGEETRPVVGRDGIAQERLAPEGYVRVGSELWRARARPEAEPQIQEGDTVRIVGRDGLTLVVTALPQSHAGDEPDPDA